MWWKPESEEMVKLRVSERQAICLIESHCWFINYYKYTVVSRLSSEAAETTIPLPLGAFATFCVGKMKLCVERPQLTSSPTPIPGPSCLCRHQAFAILLKSPHVSPKPWSWASSAGSEVQAHLSFNPFELFISAGRFIQTL